MIFQVIFFVLIMIIVLLLIYRFKFCPKLQRHAGYRTLLVIGSGGHTAEMLRLVKTMSLSYNPRLYVMASNDNTSESKVTATQFSNYTVKKVPRSRNVGQSYVTSIFTTISATIASAKVVHNFEPDLVLCNGPGICVPICVSAYFRNKIFGRRSKIVFVESICRVETLSLSGRLLLKVADSVIVQWPELKAKYPSTEYLGRLY